MSTPTAMSEPVPPQPPQQPGLSEGARIVNVFVAPSKTFFDIRRNASWWVPFVLTALLQIAFSYAFSQKIGWDSVIEKQWEKSPTMSARLNGMKPEEKERAMEQGAKFAGYIGYAAPIFGLLYLVVGGAILMAVFNFGFGADIPFKQSMAALAYGGLPMLIFSALAVLTMFVTSTPESFNINNPLATNPGYFLDPKNSKLLYWLGSCLDVFAIWVIAVLGIGYSVLTNKKVKTVSACAVIAVIYVLFKGFGAMNA
jgi:hypothetical protein